MADGCGEKFDVKFLKWIWDFPKRTRPRILKRLAAVEGQKPVFRLRSRKEVSEFLDGLRGERAP
jgi:hypothetical protein